MDLHVHIWRFQPHIIGSQCPYLAVPPHIIGPQCPYGTPEIPCGGPPGVGAACAGGGGAAAATAAVSQELWTSGEALVQGAQGPNLSLIHI